VSFQMRSRESKRLGPTRYGFVAQEVEQVLPNLVHGSGDQHRGLVYQDLLAVLTLAMKEQEKAIQESDAEVIEAQREVQSLLEQADMLERYLDEYEAGTPAEASELPSLF